MGFVRSPYLGREAGTGYTVRSVERGSPSLGGRRVARIRDEGPWGAALHREGILGAWLEVPRRSNSWAMGMPPVGVRHAGGRPGARSRVALPRTGGLTCQTGGSNYRGMPSTDGRSSSTRSAASMSGIGPPGYGRGQHSPVTLGVDLVVVHLGLPSRLREEGAGPLGCGKTLGLPARESGSGRTDTGGAR